MAKRALGTRLKKGSTYIGGLTEINGVDMSADTIDVTTLDSNGGYREYLAGFKDAGEVGISGFFDPGNLGQAAVIAAFNSGDDDTYTIEFPAAMGATWVFTGVVTKITTGAAIEDPISFEATIKVSSQPSLGTTASTGLSALAVTDGASAAISPTFANGTYNYYCAFVGAGVTLTATGASHTIKLYIDGAYIQDLTTAVSSGALASLSGFSVGQTKLAELLVYEVAKTPKTYRVTLVRAS